MYVCHGEQNRDGNIKEGIINDYDAMHKNRVRDMCLSIRKRRSLFWR